MKNIGRPIPDLVQSITLPTKQRYTVEYFKKERTAFLVQESTGMRIFKLILKPELKKQDIWLLMRKGAMLNESTQARLTDLAKEGLIYIRGDAPAEPKAMKRVTEMPADLSRWFEDDN